MEITKNQKDETNKTCHLLSQVEIPVLTSFFKKCKDNDTPTSRAHPATIAMLERLPEILDEDHLVDGQLNRNVVDLCIVAFFWLMRPAKFCGPSSRNDDLQQSNRDSGLSHTES